MKKATINIEILSYLNMLEKTSQGKVLSYIKSLFKTVPNQNGSKDILKFAGAFSGNDIQEITKAINEGCEKPDLNEW